MALSSSGVIAALSVSGQWGDVIAIAFSVLTLAAATLVVTGLA